MNYLQFADHITLTSNSKEEMLSELNNKPREIGLKINIARSMFMINDNNCDKEAILNSENAKVTRRDSYIHGQKMLILKEILKWQRVYH